MFSFHLVNARTGEGLGIVEVPIPFIVGDEIFYQGYHYEVICRRIDIKENVNYFVMLREIGKDFRR